jgi:limonene-1,2-epoxide hydrolase
MMKGKIVVTVLVVMVILAPFVPVRPAQAGIEPVLAVDHIYNALSSGDLDTAVASFAEDATVENMVRKETYNGKNEIRQMLQERQREGRRYDIVNIEMDGSTTTAKVEISDDGFVWGTETIEAVEKDGKLQTFTVKDIRLELYRIRPDASRWQGLADDYNQQRVLQADAARWTGMAIHHGVTPENISTQVELLLGN